MIGSSSDVPGGFMKTLLLSRCLCEKNAQKIDCLVVDVCFCLSQGALTACSYRALFVSWAMVKNSFDTFYKDHQAVKANVQDFLCK